MENIKMSEEEIRDLRMSEYDKEMKRIRSKRNESEVSFKIFIGKDLKDRVKRIKEERGKSFSSFSLNGECKEGFVNEVERVVKRWEKLLGIEEV